MLFVLPHSVSLFYFTLIPLRDLFNGVKQAGGLLREKLIEPNWFSSQINTRFSHLPTRPIIRPFMAQNSCALFAHSGLRDDTMRMPLNNLLQHATTACSEGLTLVTHQFHSFMYTAVWDKPRKISCYGSLLFIVLSHLRIFSYRA